jgi:hypothetical protein
VTVHSSPAGECQRYWLTVHVPDDAKAGLYRGSVWVWDDGFDQAVEIPLALRVLNFKLQKDPQKHFSVYYSVRDTVTYKGRSEEFIRRATENDYRTMVEYGLDMIPTFYLSYENGKVGLHNAGELERMLQAGLNGPVPVCGDRVIGGIYRETTPKGKTQSHWRVEPLPPAAFYDRITAALRDFEKDRTARGWPEFIYCPVDEVDSESKEFGGKVYAAVKAAGVRTYATKDPVNIDAADYAPCIDIWCSQPYSVPYDRIVSQKRFEYWCYPNHNACEIKDPLTMCKGGRMTYGFGLWRSGYTTLIPWHWSWACEPDPFDYLRGRYSGCGQRVADDGEVIPAIYWSCFREGYDDARYVYTLQQAIVERENSSDPACQAAVRDGQQLLQATWDGIRVQQKYLAEGMWPSEEFNALRWRIAKQIERLLRYSASAKATAPSVLVARTAFSQPAEPPSAYEIAAKAGTLDRLDLGKDFKPWRNGTAEGKITFPEEAKQSPNQPAMRWTVVIDHNHDGGEGGNYPIGWPRISLDFKPGELDMSQYDTLEFWIRIDSNRDEVADDRTPIGITFSSQRMKGTLCEVPVDLGGQQHVWLPVRLVVKDLSASAKAAPDSWKTISRIQIFLSEANYRDGTRLVFDIGEASLARLTSPVIAGTDAPNDLLLPRKTLGFNFDVIGLKAVTKGSHTVTAAVEGNTGAVLAEHRQDLSAPHRMAISLPTLQPGPYALRLTIVDAAGKQCSAWTQPLTAIAGPLE